MGQCREKKIEKIDSAKAEMKGDILEKFHPVLTQIHSFMGMVGGSSELRALGIFHSGATWQFSLDQFIQTETLFVSSV